MTSANNLKIKIICTSLLLIVFWSVIGRHALAEEYKLPIGIPAPGWTTDPINTETPSPPESWPGSIDGYYYVDDTISGATDTNNNGYPLRPRLTVPKTVPEGSKIFIKHCSSLTALYQVKGTADKPIWIIGINGNGIVQPQKVGTYLSFAECEYWIVDGIIFDGAGTSNISSSTAFRIDGGTNHVAIRNSKVVNMPVGEFSETRKTSAWTSALTAVVPSSKYPLEISNIVLYRLDISNNAGGQFLDYESGRHCVLSAGYSSGGATYGVKNLWILASTFYNNPEDGIQLGLSAYGADRSKCANIYIGDNLIIKNGENAIDLKASSNIIISQNLLSGAKSTVYRVGATSGSDGSAGVINDDGGGPDNDWWIFNTISNSRCGIRNQAGSGKHYIIGNFFYNLIKDDAEEWPTSTGKNGGVAYWQSAPYASVNLSNNTIAKSNGGIYINNADGVNIHGNVVSELHEPQSGFPVNINNAVSRDLHRNVYQDISASLKDADAVSDTDQQGTIEELGNSKVPVRSEVLTNFGNDVEKHTLLGGVNTMLVPSSVYSQFESEFSRSILFDIKGEKRPRENITTGAFQIDQTPKIIVK